MKRKTKQQKEVEGRANLRKRVADIATGAAGFQFDFEGESSSARVLSRLVPALKVRFGNENNQFLFLPCNLGHYDTIDSITEFFWDHDVRA